MVTEVHNKIVLEALRLILSATTAAVRVIAVASEVDGAAAHLVVADHPTEEVAEKEVAVVKTDELRSSVKDCVLAASKRAT